jgi:L-iditol 2-dehydrogenase
MKTALLTGIRQMEIRQVPDPKILHDTDVLIRIKMVGACGSDIHYYTSGRIGSQVVQFPFTVGHEAAGIVEQTGKKVTRVKPGQRIAIDPSVFCGHCDQCQAGRENTCRELLFLGCPKQLEGALSEYLVLPEICCFPISKQMTFEQAVLSEPLAIAVYSVERSRPHSGATVAIIGAGPIGMSVFHVLRTKNIGNVYITDKIPARLNYAQHLHPRWCGNPDQTEIVDEISALEPLLVDVVYECSGDPAAFDQAIRLLKPGGILTIVGIPEIDIIPFPIHELRRKEITIINIRRQANCTQKAIDLLERDLTDISAMATHHFPLEEVGRAFELVAKYQDGVMKAMIVVNE